MALNLDAKLTPAEIDAFYEGPSPHIFKIPVPDEGITLRELIKDICMDVFCFGQHMQREKDMGRIKGIFEEVEETMGHFDRKFPPRTQEVPK